MTANSIVIEIKMEFQKEIHSQNSAKCNLNGNR